MPCSTTWPRRSRIHSWDVVSGASGDAGCFLHLPLDSNTHRHPIRRFFVALVRLRYREL